MIRYPHLIFLTILLFAFTSSTTWAGTISPSLLPGMPEEVRSLTEVSLTQKQYQKLAKQWQQYSKNHPDSAIAQIMWYKALYYGGEQDTDKLQAHISKALALDPRCPEALNAAMHTTLRHGKSFSTRQECYEFGLQAVAAAPDWATPHAMLYVLATALDHPEEARQHLVALLEKDFYSPALLDYGYNMLASAADGGIIITNGDNDTFPCLSLQAAHAMRTDVSVANLSLMTKQVMAKQFLTTPSMGYPAALDIQELDSIEQKFWGNPAAYGYMLGNALMEYLCMKSSSGDLERPLYLAVTLQPEATITCGSSLVLQGLLQRVAPPGVKEYSEPVTDIIQTYNLFSLELRLDSATDLNTNWSHYPAHAQLVQNYTNILFRLGYDAGAGGHVQIMEFGFEKSLIIASFHKDQASVDLILKYWNHFAPDSIKLKQWQGRTP